MFRETKLVPILLCLSIATSNGAFIRSIEPTHGSLGGGTILTITGTDLMGNDTNGVDIYVGQLRCDIHWYSSNNELVHCETPPLHWWGSGSPGYKIMYSNWITATLTSCQDCYFEYGDDWTPRIHRQSPVMASRGHLGFGGVLKGRFSRQYTIDFGDYGKCTGIHKRGDEQLNFGLDYEQEIASSWDEDLDVQCYLPAMEAGRHNYTVHVNHRAPGVIEGTEGEAGTKPNRGSDDGLGYARFDESVMAASGDHAYTLLIVPQIVSLSTQESGSLGQHRLIITGSGFDDSQTCEGNHVTVSGVNCHVMSCTASQITCQIAAAPDPVAPAAPHKGTFGLTKTIWSNYASIDDGSSNPFITSTFHDNLDGSFSAAADRYNMLAQKVEGYFVAPYTADYTFMTRSSSPNAPCSLSVGTDHTFASLVEHGSCTTAGSDTYIKYPDLGAKTQRVPLQQGERYAFQHKQDGAESQEFRAAVRIHAPSVASSFAKSKEEKQYHSWNEVQTITFTNNLMPEVDELVIDNVCGGNFHFEKPVQASRPSNTTDESGNTLYETYTNVVISTPIDITNPATAAAALQAFLKSGWLPNMFCEDDVVVEAAGTPSVGGQITFTITSGCLPRLQTGSAYKFYTVSRWQNLLKGDGLIGTDLQGSCTATSVDPDRQRRQYSVGSGTAPPQVPVDKLDATFTSPARASFTSPLSTSSSPVTLPSSVSSSNRKLGEAERYSRRPRNLPNCASSTIVPGSRGECESCFQASHCINGYYCCPYMLKCVASSSMSCYGPIPACYPACFTRDNYDGYCNAEGCGESCSGCNLQGLSWLEYASASGSAQQGTFGTPTCTSAEVSVPTTAAPTAAPTPVPPSSQTTAGTAEMQAILDQHNVYRCMHGLELFSWDSAIAENAQGWADIGTWAHSSSDSRMIDGEYVGENLAWYSPGYGGETGILGTKAWYDEIVDTEPYGTADSMQDTTGGQIGHYTQVVWPSSVRLGCGKGSLASGGGDYWVCQYGPGGNVGGQFATSLAGPVKSATQCLGTSSDSPKGDVALSWGLSRTNAGTPADATVTVGDTVFWLLDEDVAEQHSIVSNDDSSELNSGLISAGGEWSHTFNAEGTFTYVCGLHASMVGTITVRQVPNPPTPQPTPTGQTAPPTAAPTSTPTTPISTPIASPTAAPTAAPTTAPTLGGIRISAAVVQVPSHDMRGHFRLSYDGVDYTEDLNIYWSASTIAERLEHALPQVRHVRAVKIGGYTTETMQLQFTYDMEGKNMPTLQADPTYLTNGAGSGSVTVDTATNTEGGGSDLFYDPIPAYMFEVSSSQPNVVVTVNDIVSECSTNRDDINDRTFVEYDDVYDGDAVDCYNYPGDAACAVVYTSPDCSFTYNPELTPVITKVYVQGTDAADEARAGATLVIEGTGFSSYADDEAQVQLGGAVCDIVAKTSTEISCIIRHMKSGHYYPTVIVGSVGQASINTSTDQKVFYVFEINTVEPLAGSVRGGNALKLTGTGFSNVGLENEILIAGGACVVITASFQEVTCYAPFDHTISAIDTVCWGGAAGSTCINGAYVPATHAIHWGLSTTETAGTLTITAGDSVTWILDLDSSSHSIISGLGGVSDANPELDSGSLSSGSQWTYTFNTAGNFSFFCEPHSFMVGTITVEAATPFTQIPEPTSVPLVCESGCAADNGYSWDTKCTWVGFCDGCSSCDSDATQCLSQTADNTVAMVKPYTFNAVAHDTLRAIGVRVGTYTFTGITTAHPFGVLIANTSLVEVTSGSLYPSSDDGYKYYTGTVVVEIYDDFGTASYGCALHGYMGGEDRLIFDSACPTIVNSTTDNGCPSYCNANAQEWQVKCDWTGNPCDACSQCATAAPTAAPTTTPTAAPSSVSNAATNVGAIEARIFQYEESIFNGGTFNGGYLDRSACLADVLDGAWGAWSTELETVLRDTKYYGYSCSTCSKDLTFVETRWGTMIGDTYVREADASLFVDGAWAQWTDSGNYDAWQGSEATSPYTTTGLTVDEACSDDLKTLQGLTQDGAWSSWDNPGQWGDWITSNATYTFDWKLTPSITSISPSQFSSAQTTHITIAGNFTQFQANSEGNCTASMRFVSASGLFRNCQQLEIGDSSATCLMVRGKSLPEPEQRTMFPRLQLCAAGGLPVVAHPEPDCCQPAPYYGRVDMALRIDSTSPKSGSLAGGTLITVSGAGFSDKEDVIVRSSLTYNYYDQMTVVKVSTDHKTVPCQVVSSNFTHIVCETMMLQAEDAEEHDLGFHGQLIYTGPRGRNGRVSVTVNDIGASGCTYDNDTWIPPAATSSPLPPTFAEVAVEDFSAAESCEAVSMDGGALVVDYRFDYRTKSVDFAAGVLFEVQAKRDVHVALSPINTSASRSLSDNQYMYEIVIGGWGNTQSSIRRTKFGENVVREGTSFILTGWKPKTFWVRLTGGLVEVGEGCDIGSGMFMSYDDPDPLDSLEYFGVATVDTPGGFVHCNSKDDLQLVGRCLGYMIEPVTSTTTIPTIELQYNDTTPDFTCEFDYNEASTPVFSSLSPVASTGATTLTIEGTHFTKEPTIHLGDHECPVLTYALVTNSATVWSVTCSAPSLAAGRYHVRVHVPGKGFAAHPDDAQFEHAYESLLTITSVSPSVGSWAGGLPVTLTGTGFSSVPRENSVQVEVGYMPRSAHILASSPIQLVIVMPAFEETYEDPNTNAIVSTADLEVSTIFTAGESKAAFISIAVEPEQQDHGAFGQTYQSAHRYAESVDVEGLLSVQMSEYFGKPGGSYDEETGWTRLATHITSTFNTSNAVACSFDYSDAVTPTITSISPVSGSEGTVVTIAGILLDHNSGEDTAFDVVIGGQLCTVDLNTVTATSVECTVGYTPAGQHSVFFTNGAIGTARRIPGIFFESLLTATSISHAGGSIGGGHSITIEGSGFGGGTDATARHRRDGAWGGWIIYEYLTEDAEETQLGASVSLCNKPCVVSSSTYGTIICTTGAVFTPESLHLTDGSEEDSLTGKIISSGAEPATDLVNGAAFDGVFETHFYSSASNCYVGIDLGESNAAVITKVRWFPAHQRRSLMTGGIFEASLDGITWTELHTIIDSTEAWNFEDIANSNTNGAFRYIRYSGPASSYCTVAQLEFVGIIVSPTSDCNVVVGTQRPLSHPSLGPSRTDFATSATVETALVYSYDVNLTPIVTSVSPAYGSSLGGTIVTISGSALPGSTNTASVQINGKTCNVVEALPDGTEVKCITTRRTDFLPLGIDVKSAAGANAVGLGIRNRTTAFRYLDRWSALNTWLNDEPPIEGDTVIVPRDQAILVDVPLPKLNLVLIQGFLMFEPDSQHDLNMNASYILVYGGTLRAGTEDEPFEGNLAITLHGDRYSTVQLPQFGAKVLAVADVGGLSSSAFAKGKGHEVPDSQKGVLDIHGSPRVNTWTHTAATATAGSTRITTVEPVDFAEGETIVITGHISKFTGAAASNDLKGDMPPPCMYPDPAKSTVEELIVSHLEDGGTTIVITKPLVYDHSSSIHTTPKGVDVDMRAQVGLLTRNVKIQGDDSSPDQLFGSHTIAVHGGHFRIENAEVRNCGQARILGRYCLHYHKTGYNPAPNSYLKSNSIHHSFQRATTIHGTQHALVQNNVAYHVMGHTYFVEDGDEEYVTIEGNLGIQTLTTPFSLLSDCQAATFWTATPKNIWRNNVAANSHGNGFWFELDAGAAGDFTTAPTIEVNGNYFHDNNIRGWFIAPKYDPATPQYFHNNTYTRNHQDGVFYGRGGDTHHVGDMFGSNGGSGDILWWFFPSKESSRWIPNLKDVSFVGGYWNPGAGARTIPPPTASLFAPNMEHFLVDGAEFVNYGDNAAITQCFDCCGYRSRQGAYTTRFNRMSFSNSDRRTSFACPEKQIFFDLDGSLSDEAPGTSVIAYHAFNEWEECPKDATGQKFSGGLVCNNTVRVRKVGIPLTAGVPKKYAPIVNAGRKLSIKPSRMINPMGFVAVFQTPDNDEFYHGSIPSFEKPRFLEAIALFLGLEMRDVVETAIPEAESNSPGMAVMIGGMWDEVFSLDEAGRKRVDVAHEALCSTGTLITITEVRQFSNFTHPVSRIVQTPTSCSSAGEIQPSCANDTSTNKPAFDLFEDGGVYVAGDGTRGYFGGGSGTLCAQDEGASVQDHTFPYDSNGRVHVYADGTHCKVFSSGGSLYYDTNTYSNWLRQTDELGPVFDEFNTPVSSVAGRRRRTADTAASNDPLRVGECIEWGCLDGAPECDVEHCFRASDGEWSTWIRGEDTERDDNCQTWACHFSADFCQSLLSAYRCLESTENVPCTEYHPGLQSSSSKNQACALECDAIDCSAFYTDQTNGVDIVCTLYDSTWPLIAKEDPRTLIVDANDGFTVGSDAPQAAECFHPTSNAGDVSCNENDMAQTHSETTCKTYVPFVDEFGGVDWSLKGSTGVPWRNQGRLDHIAYGPGKNGPDSFDWEGWTIPLVTHHDYILDWDWHDDFEQFSLKYAVPFILQNPEVTPVGFVPPEAQFSGEQSWNPLPDESMLLSFAYEDYRYRMRVNKPALSEVPWFDIHSDDCYKNDCSRRLAENENMTLREGYRSRGDITRFDAFGTGMMDREDESLISTGTGGEWKVALNPWYGVNRCEDRPKPVDFSFTVEALQCPPGVCVLPNDLGFAKRRSWSNPSTWFELAFVDKITPTATETGDFPEMWDVVEVPGGYTLIMDVDPPMLSKVIIVGKLEYDDSADRELNTELLGNFGYFDIGKPDQPFEYKAALVIHGNRSSTSLVLSDQIFLGNKVFANFGNVAWYGNAPSVVRTKLAATADAGATTLTFVDAVDWNVGDSIVVTGTDYNPAVNTFNTGTFSGSTFVVLPGPDELTAVSDDCIVGSISADKKTITLQDPLAHRHFAGEIDVGFDKDAFVFDASDGSQLVAAAVAITYGPPVNIAGLESVPADANGWDTLRSLPVINAKLDFDPCTTVPPNSLANLYADQDQIVLVDTAAGCEIPDLATNLQSAGAIALIYIGDGSQVTLNSVGIPLPTIVLSPEVGATLKAMVDDTSLQVAFNAKSVELRATVGNLQRNIVVRGEVETGCTNAQHSANVDSYIANCQELNMEHHMCEENGHVPHDCNYMKGYGVHMYTGELNYGSVDEVPGQTQLGEVVAVGVEFRNFGKLSTKHRGFTINYFSEFADGDDVNNLLDHCVFRNNWQDGIVISRSPAVTIVDTIIHKTLGVGISTGDRWINWAQGDRRDRRSFPLSNPVPKGGLHVIDRNLVSDSFAYPHSDVGSAIPTSSWQSGMYLRVAMASLADNIVTGAAHGGMSFELQDAQDLQSGHVISNNEAVGCKYGAILFNQGGAGLELYTMKAWKNTRAGVVGFDESADIQLRKAVLADNHFGAVFSYKAPGDVRVSDSFVIGTSAATDTTSSCPGRRVGLVLPRYGLKPRCLDPPFGGCKGCAIEGSMMDMRFGNTNTGRMENFYVDNTRFAHFGTGSCSGDGNMALAINEDESDYTPDLWLSQISWLPSVDMGNRFKLGDISYAHADCDKSCDAVNYLKAHDVDGTTIGDFWSDGSADNFAGTIMYSDRNPAQTVEPKCKADSSTESIICRNYAPSTMEVHIPPPCEGCLPPLFVTVHKYNADGLNGAKENRTYWTMGAFEEGCSCSKHFMGGSFPVEAGPEIYYDVDMPVEDALNVPDSFEPEWIPPNTEFIFHSNDPAECVLLRLRMLDSKPVVLFLNGENAENQKLADGSFPTTTDTAGTNVLNPQQQKFFMTVCGGAIGTESYMLRVREAVQVNMEIEMNYGDFFAEDPPTAQELEDAGGSIPLYQRTTGLNKLVNNFATLLNIPASQIKVVCVHPVGEPCIPNELLALLGGFNVGTQRGRRVEAVIPDRCASGVCTWVVDTSIEGPNDVALTGDKDVYDANVAALTAVKDKILELSNSTGSDEEDDEFISTITNGLDGLIYTKVIGVLPNFGNSAMNTQAFTVAQQKNCDAEGYRTSTYNDNTQTWSDCTIAACDAGSGGLAPDCSSCDVDGFAGSSVFDTISLEWSACSIANCSIGSNGIKPACSSCNVNGYSGSSTWDGATWGACTVATCDAGSSNVAPTCGGTCDVDGYTGTSTWTSPNWSTCAVASCDVGSTGTAPECDACDDEGYTGTSTWTSPNWSTCTVASCDVGTSGVAPACGACNVDGYSGSSTWDGTTWGACTVVTCDAGSSGDAPACGTCDADDYFPSLSTWNGTVWSACTLVPPAGTRYATFAYSAGDTVLNVNDVAEISANDTIYIDVDGSNPHKSTITDVSTFDRQRRSGTLSPGALTIADALPVDYLIGTQFTIVFSHNCSIYDTDNATQCSADTDADCNAVLTRQACPVMCGMCADLESSTCVLVVDVRNVEDYNADHAPCAVNFPHATFSENIAKVLAIYAAHAGTTSANILLESDLNRQIAVHGYNGVRAELAKGLLLDSGFTNVKNLGGWDTDNAAILEQCKSPSACRAIDLLGSSYEYHGGTTFGLLVFIVFVFFISLILTELVDGCRNSSVESNEDAFHGVSSFVV